MSEPIPDEAKAWLEDMIPKLTGLDGLKVLEIMGSLLAEVRKDDKERIAALTERVEQLEAAAWLAGEDQGFYMQGGGKYALLVNDTFGYACADCEVIDLKDAPKVKALVQAEGWPAVVKWVAEVRGSRPLPEVEEKMQTWATMRAEIAALTEERDRLRAERNELMSDVTDYEDTLGDIYDRLCAAEKLLTTKDQARLVGGALERCKYLKEPEWTEALERRRADARRWRDVAEKTGRWVRHVVYTLHARHVSKSPNRRRVFWAEVQEVFPVGSTSACEIARFAGYDPETGAPLDDAALARYEAESQR
jgi:hypothetical protein